MMPNRLLINTHQLQFVFRGIGVAGRLMKAFPFVAIRRLNRIDWG